MLPNPPPDEPCDEFAISLDRVFMQAVGKGEGTSVEVLAFENRQFYRFDLPGHSRSVRKFWKDNGIKDATKLDGVVETTVGYGPFTLRGVVVGHDLNPTATDGDEKTYVLRDVELRGK